MAYRRPAIEVVQEFQAAAAALALPTLPACIVGPGFQIKDDVNAGTYSETDLSVSSYAYDGLTAGAIVDLTDAPSDEADANAHKGVGVTLTDLQLVTLPVSPLTTRVTGTLAADNKFQDAILTAAFGTIDPTAAGATTYYVEIISGPADTANLGLKKITGKTSGSNSELEVQANWAIDTDSLPLTDVEYRIVEYRESEVYPADAFAANGISKTDSAVTITPGLKTVTDDIPLVVRDATVNLSWRALRPDLAGALTAFTDIDSLEAVFGVGAIVPANIGPYAVSLSLQNTTTEVGFSGLAASYYTNEEQSYQSAFEYLETKDVYAITPCTQLTAVHQTLKSHVEGMSASSVGKERIGFVNRDLVELEVLAPASGIGTTTSAGTDNGLAGTDNKTFKDPDEGSFITDDVNVGHYLEITSYSAIEGVERAITPNEADYLAISPGDAVHMTNAAFTSADTGRFLLVDDATTVGNNLEYALTFTDATHAALGSTPAAGEVLPSTAKTYIVEAEREITANDGVDAVVSATRTWTFTLGGFVDADIGRKIRIAGSTSNDGVYTIATVDPGGTSMTTEELPPADETFSSVTQKVYNLVRQIARDVSHDAVDGTLREWTFIGGTFTDDDIGRKLVITDAANADNNDVTGHVIEAIVDATTVRTSNVAPLPVTEDFNGLAVNITANVVASEPSTAQDAYITGTRHQIESITSDSELLLVTDPTSGFGGELEDVEYRITKDLSLNEQADVLAGYSVSLGSRRVYNTWPNVLAVSINGLATKVPGYFAGAVYTGMVAGLPSQAGFTNLAVTGFVGRENSDDIFSDTQLDTIAGGGTMILTQPVPDAALVCRHQLSTDVSTIYFQELSITKNVDLVARFFRGLFRPFLGIYNITDTLLDILKTRGEGGVEYLKAQRAPRVGAPLRSGQLTRIAESTIQPDSVEIDVNINIPVPLNNITLSLLV